MNVNSFEIKPLTKQEMVNLNGGLIPIAAYYIGSFIVGLAIGLYITYNK